MTMVKIPKFSTKHVGGQRTKLALLKGFHDLAHTYM